MLIGALSSLLAASAATMVLLDRIWGVDGLASLSFTRLDGWCDIQTEAIGGHCWGDYAAVRFDSLGDRPGDAEALYPMSTRILRIPFALVEDAWGYRPAVLLWLGVLAVCMVGPAVWATRRYPIVPRSAAILVCAVATMPVLVVLDRGNIIGLAVPCLAVFALGLMRDRPLLASIGIVLATCVKPQFGLLVVALVSLRRWRELVWCTAGLVVVAFVPPLIVGGQGLGGSVSWIRESVAWSSAHSASAAWPVNVSFAHAFGFLVDRVGWALGREPSQAAVAAIGGGLALAFIGASMILLAWRGRRLERLTLCAAVMAVASLATPVSFSYYFVFALAVAAVILALGLGSPDQRRRGLDAVGRWSLLAAVTLSLTPLLLPLSGPGQPQHFREVIVESLVPVLGTLAWTGVVAVACIRLVAAESTGPNIEDWS